MSYVSYLSDKFRCFVNDDEDVYLKLLTLLSVMTVVFKTATFRKARKKKPFTVELFRITLSIVIL
jgi:hypothetical protein